jgi:hypothetical protein
MTRSITTWARIEPEGPRPQPGPDAGLEARVYDPAWFLGRQWQLGELNGEDTASPAWARARLSLSPFTRLRRGDDPAGPIIRMGSDDLLEPLVEAESALVDAPDWTAAAAAGAHFLAVLAQARLASLGPAFVAAFPLPDPARVDLDAEGRRRLRLLRRGSFDGIALARAARAQGTPGAPAIPSTVSIPRPRAGAVVAAIRRWLAWYPDESPGTGQGWQPARLEYRFAVAARTPLPASALGTASAPPAEYVFEGPEYGGGRLDWTDLRLVPGARLGAADDPEPRRVVCTALPSPVTYPGMPANRWWEIEDRRVWFGGVAAEAGDTARLLLIEFASVYGNDWFLLPVGVEPGSVAQVAALVVLDTFGQATLVRPASHPGWRMFQVSGAPPGLLVVPPVLGPGLEGPPVEEVLLTRDEGANLAWAVERRVTGPAGNVIDRYEEWRERRPGVPEPAPPEGVPLTYRLMSAVPDHWIPLVPRSDGRRSIRLHRGVVIGGDGRAVPPHGRLLEPGRPLAFFEEEVPRSGVLVTRAWQLARTPGGRTLTWIGRRARPGRGEASSNIGFDELRDAVGPP